MRTKPGVQPRGRLAAAQTGIDHIQPAIEEIIHSWSRQQESIDPEEQSISEALTIFLSLNSQLLSNVIFILLLCV